MRFHRHKPKKYQQIVNKLWIQEKDTIEVSLIIPSFNKYPLNLLSLYSLESQTIDLKKLEVVFVDDASSDETFKVISKLKVPYPFRYVRCFKNLGRAKARNTGIKLSKGKIIVLIDAEMIVPPDFIKSHVEEHMKHDRAIVTGGFHLRNSYTVIYPQFSTDQLGTVKELAKADPVFEQRFTEFESNEYTKRKKWFSLVAKEDILTQKYNVMSLKDRYYANQIVWKYGEGLTSFKFPWMGFLTGNVSVKRDFFKEVGLLDEEFVLYGYEDWELGYRFYKAGATFIVNPRGYSYHQEHPIGESKRDEAIFNYYLFTKKHPDVNVLVLGLELIELIDLHDINNVLTQYERLCENHPNEHKAVKGAFTQIITVIPKLLIEKKDRNIVLREAGITKEKQEEIKQDLLQIKEREKYNHFIHLFEQKLFKLGG
ncbi:glycosyltransferase family 2 protein [Bacillus alkalicellulosilyticus]|uniref:glycosyltransferase family 2 protein n=1 Tax=Alkalihalobacterium alkalicellulosilyticum TaxID=1912214 RepID=UPI000996CEBD|nr:glycosyltransferase [Bacillus alkalicellulosilyticus]